MKIIFRAIEPETGAEVEREFEMHVPAGLPIGGSEIWNKIEWEYWCWIKDNGYYPYWESLISYKEK